MEKKVFGFDIDGVISRGLIPGSNYLLRKFENQWSHLLNTKIGRLIYKNLRRINPEMLKIIQQIYSIGHQVILISAVEEKHRKIVEEWLKSNGCCYHRLRLKDLDSEEISDYKVRAIKEEGCQFFLDDNPSIIKVLQNLNTSCCEFLCYRKGLISQLEIFD